jgi:hypothetical protein
MEPRAGEVYQHYKGNFYTIIGLGTHSETEELMVVYKSNDTNRIWVRPLKMFNESVSIDGTRVDRFKKCTGNDCLFHNS